MGVQNPSSQVLEFLTVTSLPFREVNDEETRRIVRSHAIRDANRRKRMKTATNDKEPRRKSGNHASRPLPQSSFTTKFRLNGKNPKARQRRGSQEETVNGLRIVPGSGIFDPFDTLPIKIGPRQQALIEYQHSALKQNAFAFYSKERLFSYAASDPAWLHATLSLISLHHDLKQGEGISRECLFHRGEALRIVNQRLVESPGHVSDPTIGAIASLANFDTTNGLFTSATMHVNGLVEIVSKRGAVGDSLVALQGNDLLQKIVAWSDLCYSTFWDLTPRFPIITSAFCRASIPEFIAFFRDQFDASTSFTSSHDLVGEMSEIFQVLRMLSIIMSKPSIATIDQAMFTRGVYITEYKLLIVLDQTDDLDDEIVLNRNSHIYGSCRLAAYLYLYIALRELPVAAAINRTLVKRLKSILEGVKGDLLVLWKEDQHLLLWISFMGSIAGWNTPDRGFFVGIMRRLVKEMGVDTLETFTGALKEVLWLKEFDNKRCTSSSTWEEIMDL